MKNICKGSIKYTFKQTFKNEPIFSYQLSIQILISVIVPFVSIYIPTVVLKGVTRVYPYSDMMLRIGILCGIIAICNFSNEYIRAMMETHLMNNKICFLSQLFQKRLRLDYQFIESIEGQNKYQCAFESLINDNKGITALLKNISDFIGKVCSMILYIGILSTVNPIIIIVVLVSSFVHFFITSKYLKFELENREKWADIDRKIGYVSDCMVQEQYSKDIKMYSMQSYLSDLLTKLCKEHIVWIKRTLRYNKISAIVDIFFNVVRDGVAYFFIFNGILNHSIQVPEFMLYFSSVALFSELVHGVTNDISNIKRNIQEVTVVKDYIEYPDSKRGNSKIVLQPNETISIVFDHVYFQYSEDSPYVLEDVSFRINKGEKIAIVGENGAGKSTLIKLLCGFYHPTKGVIRINEINIDDIPKEHLYSLLAVVFQDIHILPMSLKDNITLTDENVNEQQLEDSIRLSGVDQFVKDTSISLTKMFDEKGINLSGGQAQKLLIARAYYKNAAALILDEPTSALDPIAEKELYEKYSDLTKNKTSVFISHRLASTRFCDRILVLNNGKIEMSGTHEELVQVDGTYKELYTIQSSYYVSEVNYDKN